MTEEERRAMAIWELRAVGIHPDYIRLLLEEHSVDELLSNAVDIGRICNEDPKHPWLHPYDEKTDTVFKKRR